MEIINELRRVLFYVEEGEWCKLFCHYVYLCSVCHLASESSIPATPEGLLRDLQRHSLRQAKCKKVAS